jgi:flagellin
MSTFRWLAEATGPGTRLDGTTTEGHTGSAWGHQLEGAVREINNAIAASSDPAVRDAGLSASLVTDNDGNTTISISGAFDAEFSVTGGAVTLADGTGDDNTGATSVALFTADQASVQTNLTGIDIGTRLGAAEALAVVDGALTQVNSLRAELGAVQIRFESTISNLSVSVENLSAARSRIRDADFAAETAELTRSQILQQAGISVLAQANATPQSVLALLQ